ncbi:MAG: branched-chain amino acid transport system II carrier protein [Ezakiella sp.]|nr:branched-chain amino acid transport system II carrier protein [Ezakiella sp.]MDD7471466.1 branched-chain amino acid transport system II carrier protein [Bacillota bacterium]MDY3923668.1 branched-chain amino acid transport system II carrier protein [Ezakiella sp.]
MKKLSKKEFLSISLLLFSMFFGAGNLIFPPMLGNLGAKNMFPALMGFTITAVVLPVLGILAVAKTNGIQNLGKKVGNLFAFVFPAVIFLAIGPGIAIPRNASLAFEMSVVPYLGERSEAIYRLLYTLAFFGWSFFLSLNPKKLVDRIGKVLTPLLLTLIAIFAVGVFVKYPSAIGEVSPKYSTPLTTGFLEGYNTLDALAALNFGFVISLAVRKFQIKDDKTVLKYVSRSGLLAGSVLFVVYALLAKVGKMSSLQYAGASNGGKLLFNVTHDVFGAFGSVVMILIFTIACLSTAVGLITSVSQYFTTLTKEKLSYKSWVFIFTFVSLVLANFGLDTILKFSVPVLNTIYPVAIILILMALSQDFLNLSKQTYKISVYVTLFISVIDGFKTAGITLPVLSALASKLPLSSVGLGWVLPFALSLCLSEVYSRFSFRPAEKRISVESR